jgi:2-polyprenyl-3-methyl-5-hydroxy-6-metoxy-1,4-benzoquinol methylase
MFRRLVQRRLDATRLRKLGGRVDGGTVLEIGCGRGFGVEAALDMFGAKQVHAFDADREMVGLAQRELTQRRLMAGANAPRIWHGNVQEIQAGSGEYDAVFDYQVLHHVGDWRSALAEISRVIKPGGKLFLVESLRGFLVHPLWGRWMDHPSEDRFTQPMLLEELECQGFTIEAKRSWGNQLLWLVALRN